MDVVALDRDLREDLEGDLLLAAELLDVPVRARLLVGEVVGREGQDLETLGLVLFVE